MNASERLAAIQLEKIRKDEQAKKGAMGCVLVVVALVIGAAIWGSSIHHPATTNAVSNYAHEVGLIVQLDGAAEREVKASISDEDFTHAYSIASRTRDDATAYSGKVNSDAPDGFDRTKEAVSAYIGETRDRYGTAADLANDPSPANVEKMRRVWSSTYLKALHDAFVSDLSHTRLSRQEKARVMARFLGQRQ